MAFQTSAVSSSQRPVAITVICIIMAVLVVLGAIGLITLMTAATAAGLTPTAGSMIYSVASVVLTGVSAWGLWMMKKWGLYLYTALFVVGLIMSFITAGVGGISIISNLIPLVVVVICWVYQARMT
jgi:hypothetical protein